MSAVLSWLLIGDKQSARDRELLRRHNVRYIVNVTPPRTEGGVANFFEKEACFEYLRLPLRDIGTDSVLEYLPKAVEFLQRARVREDGCVLVHCNEGKSRSSSIVIGYLIQTHGVTFDEAFSMVRAVRPQAEPKEAFRRQLLSLRPTELPCGSRKRVLEDGAPINAMPTKKSAGPSQRMIGPSMRPSLDSHHASEDLDEDLDEEKCGATESPLSAPLIGPAMGPSSARGTSAPIIGPTMGPPSAKEECANDRTHDAPCHYRRT